MLFERTAGSAGGAAWGSHLGLSQFGAFPGPYSPSARGPAVVPVGGAGEHEGASRASASPPGGPPMSVIGLPHDIRQFEHRSPQVLDLLG